MTKCTSDEYKFFASSSSDSRRLHAAAESRAGGRGVVGEVIDETNVLVLNEATNVLVRTRRGHRDRGGRGVVARCGDGRGRRTRLRCGD
jgi:hypothetical protein